MGVYFKMNDMLTRKINLFKLQHSPANSKSHKKSDGFLKESPQELYRCAINKSPIFILSASAKKLTHISPA